MNPSEFLPLREPTYFILLSLAPGKRHGYSILKDVEALSKGQVRLGTGTLYGALSRLLEQGLIQRVSDDDAPDGTVPPQDERARGGGPGRPRKAYQLTPAGRQVLQAEARRLDALLSAARLRLGEERA